MSTNTRAPAQKNKQPAAAAADKKEVKILMLHGYAQNGPLFRSKTGAMSKMMAKAMPTVNVTRIYPTGPHKLAPSDIPGFQPREEGAEQALEAYGWFWHDEAPTGALRGFEQGMEAIAAAIAAAGGVDGVLGFSQGGAVGALVAAALQQQQQQQEETSREQPAAAAGWVRRLREANGGRRLRFCVVYSGFVARAGAGLEALYEGGIATPTCHFVGSLDSVVEEARSRALAERCVGAEVVVHPGGHHVPVRKEWVAPLLGFLKRVLEEEEEAS